MRVIKLGGYSSNCILLKEEKVIIDTGLPETVNTLISEIEKDFQIQQLCTIINTHAHFDHTGGNIALKEASGARILAYGLDAQKMREGDSSYTAAEVFGAEFMPLGVEIIEKQFLGWKIIPTPGHTLGSISMYKEGILICGDLVFFGGVPGRFDLPGGNKEALKRSLQAALELPGLKKIIPGHGEVITKPKQALLTALRLL